MKIALVVGHEKLKPGALAVSPFSYYEYAFNRNLASLIADLCHKKQWDVFVFLRDNMGETICYEQVKKWQPDCTVELHFNSDVDKRAFGTETLCGPYIQCQKFAKALQTSICHGLNRYGKGDRGVKTLQPSDRGFNNVTLLQGAPMCLIEPFFGSNSSDCELAVPENLAQYVVNGIEDWRQACMN